MSVLGPFIAPLAPPVVTGITVLQLVQSFQVFSPPMQVRRRLVRSLGVLLTHMCVCVRAWQVDFWHDIEGEFGDGRRFELLRDGALVRRFTVFSITSFLFHSNAPVSRAVSTGDVAQRAL